MAYSTGSGDHAALVAAVLAHAVLDGWVEAGGVGTGWPISKGAVRGVDLGTTFTAVENDMTIGGAGGSLTQRFLRLGLGASTALATTDAASTTTIIPNMAYNFTEWHIFSEVALNDHVHVVYKFSNGPMADCWGHFSFGEVDKGGLTYNSIAYATGWGGRAYAVTGDAGSAASDWNSLNRTRNGWDGNVGEGDDGSANITINVHSTTAPTPDGTAGWPSWDTNYSEGDQLWGKCFRLSHDNDSSLDFGASFINGYPSINYAAWIAAPPASTGTITLMPIPLILINGAGSTSRIRWAGTFPNVRKCGMDGVADAQEIDYGSEVWKLFPLLRNTTNDLLGDAFQVTSGRAGIAFKKVV